MDKDRDVVSVDFSGMGEFIISIDNIKFNED